MIVIVEGIDRIGKTTLCDKLSKKLSFPVFKQFPIDDDGEHPGCKPMAEQLHALVLLLDSVRPDVIVDRFHLTELVYGNLDRGYDSSKYVERIDTMLSSIDDVALVLIQPNDIDESSRQHGDDLRPHAKMFKDAYDVSFIKRKFTCDYTTIGEVVERIYNLTRDRD